LAKRHTSSQDRQLTQPVARSVGELTGEALYHVGGAAVKIHPALTYTAGRTALMAAVAAALFAVGFRSWALVLLAIVISMPLSWFVLRRQREQLAERAAVHQQRRQQERAALRAVLDEQNLDEQTAEPDRS